MLLKPTSTNLIYLSFLRMRCFMYTQLHEHADYFQKQNEVDKINLKA